MRIPGQLIDTNTSAHISDDRFDGALDDIFDPQQIVANERSRNNRTAPAAVGNETCVAQTAGKPERV